jgi:hypothetical protein
MVWIVARSISHLPGDEDAALTADLHADKALVKAWNCATGALMKRHGLHIAQFGFAVVSHHRLAVLVLHRLTVFFRGVEHDAIGGPITCV